MLISYAFGNSSDESVDDIYFLHTDRKSRSVIYYYYYFFFFFRSETETDLQSYQIWWVGIFFTPKIVFRIWAASWQNQQNDRAPSKDSDQTGQISLCIRPVWSESSLPAWWKLGPLATHWAHSEESDQTWRMPRLIWVFAGRTCHFVCFIMRRLNFKCLALWHCVLRK